MRKEELRLFLADFDAGAFVSGAHTSQHRLLGFITTNIRSPKTFTDYIGKLLPQYISRKDNLAAWEEWTAKPEVLQEYKQMFRRLEIAKILFRKVKDSPQLNDIGEKLYRILDRDNGDKYLDFILYLYLLSGRYFDVPNQPLVEIEKVLHSYKGDLIFAIREIIAENKINRLLLATMFYNPAEPKALDLAYELLQDENYPNESIEYLAKLLGTKDSMLWKRAHNAGGIGNFKSDAVAIVNYYFLKLSTQQTAENKSYEDIINSYINLVFDTGLNEYFKLSDKDAIIDILLNKKNLNILKDIFEFASGLKFDNNLLKRGDRKNIKQKALEKYDYKCFFDYFADNENDHLAHQLNYFETKKSRTYLEGHHMVQMENSKFFEKDIDVVENIVPVCPNCHRKLHNAKPEVIMKMLKLYYTNSNKRELIRKGIFVDIDTLARFYGIEGE